MKPRDTENLRLAALAKERGIEHERRVLLALRLPERPAWLLGARAGNADDDRNGVDIYIMTRSGSIPLQVKSSPEAARLYRKRRRKRGLPMSPSSS